MKALGMILFAVALAAAPARADYVAGKAAYEAKDYITAYRELLPLAEARDPRAQYLVGMMLYHGYGVAEDEARALKLLLDAAEQGYASAQYEVGFLYSMGRGFESTGEYRPVVEYDGKRSYRWFLRAAKQGFHSAYGALSRAYCFGTGAPEDHLIAYGWWALYLGEKATDPRYWQGYSCSFDFEPTREFMLTAIRVGQELARQHNLPGQPF